MDNDSGSSLANLAIMLAEYLPDDRTEQFDSINPTVPTHHPPGSPEKVAILRARMEAGQDLWHELDNNWRDKHPSSRMSKPAAFASRQNRAG